MDATFDKGATMIVMKPGLRIAGRTFEAGDSFPWRQMALAERKVRQLIEQRWLGELTKKNMEGALKHRPEGSMPRGFTRDGLVALGLIDFEQIPEKSGEEHKTDTLAEGDGEIYRDDFRIVKTKNRNFTMFDVYDLEGHRLNPGGRLNGQKKLDAFIDKFIAEREKIAGAEEGGGAPERSPLDRDGDGEDGGSLPEMTDDELKAAIAEAEARGGEGALRLDALLAERTRREQPDTEAEDAEPVETEAEAEDEAGEDAEGGEGAEEGSDAGDVQS